MDIETTDREFMGLQPERYTLSEAKLELDRRECSYHGHRWTVLEAMGRGPVRLLCDRCGESRKVQS